MSVNLESKKRLGKLIAASNAVTGSADADLTAAVSSLIAGFGQGGGGDTPSVPSDGKTRLYVHLEPERLSPILGCCPNGTVTVDWGDGTEPDILIGDHLAVVKWAAHTYSGPGDYVITLSVDGKMDFIGGSADIKGGILRYSSGADGRNKTYAGALRRVEIGEGVATIGQGAFQYCHSLASITIPEGVRYISSHTFFYCVSLIDVTLPDSVVSFGQSVFNTCNSLQTVVLPDTLVEIPSSTFHNCFSLKSVTIPAGVKALRINAFCECCSLTSVTLPAGLGSIGSKAFYRCYGVRRYDFTACVNVPTLSNVDAFEGIPDDCEMLIPAALYDKWRNATNWSPFASYMVAV